MHRRRPFPSLPATLAKGIAHTEPFCLQPCIKLAQAYKNVCGNTVLFQSVSLPYYAKTFWARTNLFVRNAEILAPARRQLIAVQEAQMQQHGQQPELPFVSKYKVRFSQTMTVEALTVCFLVWHLDGYKSFQQTQPFMTRKKSGAKHTPLLWKLSETHTTSCSCQCLFPQT